MVYKGSKAKYLKYLLPHLQSSADLTGAYVEPFVGGANVIHKVVAPVRIGNDAHPYLIALLDWVSRGGDVMSIDLSRDRFGDAKDDVGVDLLFKPHEIGALGFLCGFGGNFFGKYLGDCAVYKNRDYIDERRRNILKQNLGGIKFINGNFEDLNVPRGATVYIDPPYRGTSGYSGTSFDSDLLFEWAINLNDVNGNTIFLSEYDAPSDFTCIESIRASSRMGSTDFKSVEKLFTII